MDQETAAALVAGHQRWYQRYEIHPGVMTPGRSNVELAFAQLDLPESLAGKRVLDLGASDGFYTLQCLRRGAEVVAFDYRPRDFFGFSVMEQVAGTRVRHVCDNFYNIAAHELGRFDVVLCLGLLYHLADPLRALWLLRQLCRERLYLATEALQAGDGEPLLRYCPADSYLGDLTNYFLPNGPALTAMLEDFGFQVERCWQPFERRLYARARVDPDAPLPRKGRMAYTADPAGDRWR